MAPNPAAEIASKTRELLQVQIGSQILALCEANAKLDVMANHLDAAIKERDALKKAGEQAE